MNVIPKLKILIPIADDDRHFFSGQFKIFAVDKGINLGVLRGQFQNLTEH